MSKNKIVKSVAFNITNPNDEQILNAVKRRNFSKYVKELLLKDIGARDQEKAKIEPVAAVEEQPKPLTAAQKMARMRERINQQKN